eukprot:CAMPEP_0194236172 /NCGR_PEP_ID=MMETSP0158-20130606/3500_1 /TAXON_ID=33649 /ORGANISM="Thalassionema nitzschioides, Strain L26-B" /LENGTH=227 /DNA_ID=CAMNT_0038969867 /DNA_START=1 /DNA_END=684 /DNA_ORIENTATION=+
MLSGCSLASSFVGFVHILKEESSDSSQKAATVAKSVKDSLSAEFEEATLEGAFGVSSSVTTTAKALLSKSHLNNHASLICRGIIPSMTSKTMTTSVMTMQPGPKEITENLEQMNGKSDPSNDTMDGQIGAAKKGQQFLSLTTSHIEGAVTSLGKVQDAKNQVFDTESMFNAFDDYVKKAAVGDAGVPTNFYIKAVSKADVAKCYIRKYYSNGLRYGESSKMAQYGSD